MYALVNKIKKKIQKYHTVEVILKYHTVGLQNQISKSQKDTTSIHLTDTYIHDWSFFWLGRGTSIKDGRIILVLWTQNLPLIEMML